MKLVKVVIILGIIFMIPAMGFAFQIKVINETGEDYFYNLWWIDHEADAEEPAMVAGGELVSGESDDFEFNYVPGLYYVVWYDKFGSKAVSTALHIQKSVDKIILKPENEGLVKLMRS